MTSTGVADFSSAIAEALAVLDIRSPTSHSWMGTLVELPAAIARLTDRDSLRSAQVVSVCATLYNSYYTQGAPRPAMPDGGVRVGVERTLSDDLAAANEGAGCVEPGWRVVGEEAGRLIVQGEGLRLWVAADDIAGGAAAAIGETVSVRLPPDLPSYSPGFYIARGDRSFSAETPQVFDRFYLNLRPEGAVPFIRAATRRLNAEGLAFSAKVADDPAGFDRRDSAVLVFERRDRRRALAGVEEIRTAVAAFLDEGVPAMTLRMGPGLGFAEDPGGGDGFGWHRCMLVAEAVMTAADRELREPEERIGLVREQFARAGIGLDAPHLGPPADGVTGASDLLDAAVGA